MKFTSRTVGLAMATVVMLMGAGCVGTRASSGTGDSTGASGTIETGSQGGGIDDSSLTPGAPVNDYEPDISSPSQ